MIGDSGGIPHAPHTPAQFGEADVDGLIEKIVATTSTKMRGLFGNAAVCSDPVARVIAAREMYNSAVAAIDFLIDIQNDDMDLVFGSDDIWGKKRENK